MLNKVVDLERDKLREMPDIGHDLPIFARGRLTLEPGEPDYFGVPAKVTTLHFSPYVGCYEFTEIDLPLGGYAADTNFDIFYKNHVLYSEAWTNDTTRNVAIARVQGYLSHATDDQKRFVGTIRTTDAVGTCAWSVSQRFVSNYYNRIPAGLWSSESTAHVYNGAFRLWNNSTANNLLEWVHCEPNGQMLAPTISSNLVAGADGNFAQVRPYIDGVVTAPVINMRNENVQKIKFGLSSTIDVLTTGYHIMSAYEEGNHAASTFDELRMGVIIMA